MKPFILNFSECPNGEILDYSLIEYSEKLNLSVVKGSDKPAVSFLSNDTVTMLVENKKNYSSTSFGGNMLLVEVLA